MNFYHDLIVKKSWDLLKSLKPKYEFVLIDGWAVYLYTKGLKSKDIDLILSFTELNKLKEEFEISKNERLRKYGARAGESEIDVYLPFYSNPGLPAEDLGNFAVNLEGFKVPQKEILAVLKQKALLERKESVKGRKDLIDLVSPFQLRGFNWQKYQQIIKRYQLENQLKLIAVIIGKTLKLEELDLNVHQMAALKREILSHLA